jgi:thiol-disulfide isomerase/thioredoxin
MRYSDPDNCRMRIWRPFAIFMLLLSGQPALGDVKTALPSFEQLEPAGPAILLFWAAWCAPCRAEIADYSKIATAAAPIPVFVITLDTPARRAENLLTAVPRGRLRTTSLSTMDVQTRWPEAAGLPLAIALDHTGATCGLSNGRLTAERVSSLLSRCHPPS